MAGTLSFCRMAARLKNKTISNAAFLVKELNWLQQVIDLRLGLYFGNKPSLQSITDLVLPEVNAAGSAYEKFVSENKLGMPERLLLILALAPYLKPELLDGFYARNTTYDKRFTEFGGSFSENGFVPTGQTVFFLLAGTKLEDRLPCFSLFNADCSLMRSGAIVRSAGPEHGTWMDMPLRITDDFVSYFVSGAWQQPVFGDQFPAKLLTTGMEWADLILSAVTTEIIEEIRDWAEHSEMLSELQGFQKRVKPGYKALFYGPPGTGKTLTATLLGKATGHDVYRIDLSMIVSRYIGETEKNLARVFERAQNKNWILFFDEADALFAKRTEVDSSNDRYANQEVAYLLQRIEDHPGIVILASNLKDNIDQAFLRRFQSLAYFPVPGPEERYRIWKNAFPEQLQPEKEIDLYAIAEKHQLTGGAIVNVVRYCCLKAVKNQMQQVPVKLIETGIRKEQQKEGIIF
jgi:hypothetical protein